MEQQGNTLAITGWGIISPIGIGEEEFTKNLFQKSPEEKPVPEHFSKSVPFNKVCRFAEFNVVDFLGSKGTRSMDRTTGMAVATVGMALQNSGIELESDDRSRVGVVLGTSTGSIKSIVDFTSETLLQERPYLVNPGLFPNTVMNCAAGQCAIWHRLKGVNATISGGRFSTLLALRYASLAIRRGHADLLLAGGVEELSEQSAWAYYHMSSAKSRQKVPVGEGCAMFVLEDTLTAKNKDRKILAEILSCEIDFCQVTVSDDIDDLCQAITLASCIHRTLAQAQVSTSEIWAVCKNVSGDTRIDDIQNKGLQKVLGQCSIPHEISINHLVGESFSASIALQISALLSLFARNPNLGDRNSLVTAVSSDGRVGCILIRSRGD